MHAQFVRCLGSQIVFPKLTLRAAVSRVQIQPAEGHYAAFGSEGARLPAA